MIVVCSNCTAHLEVANAKAPLGLFTESCPNCRSDPQVPVYETAAALLANWGSEPTVPAPTVSLDSSTVGSDPYLKSMPAIGKGEIAQLLTGLLQQSLTESAKDRGGPDSETPEQRRAIVCVEAAYRDVTERKLRDSGYKVFTAIDAAQIFERIRALAIDVVILDPDFGQAEQGTAFIERETGMLQPAKRRRIFFVHLSASARTADSHQAFLKDVNLIVNVRDIEALPKILESVRRDFNDLYRDFNKAPNLSAS